MRSDNGRLRMTRGDYGVPLQLCVMERCRACGDELEPDDRIRAEILREGRALSAWEVAWEELKADGGVMELYLTAEEAAQMPLGFYAFRVLLLREGTVRNTLFASIVEVVP